MNANHIDGLEHNLINELRQQHGLPTKRFSSRVVYNEKIAVKPDMARLTGRKEERDFVYLNINGGDSWGYYHPVTSPEVLFNFKGESRYLIRELLPDYYPAAKKRAKEAREDNKKLAKQKYIRQQHEKYDGTCFDYGRVHLVFRDGTTDQYYIGYHDFERRINCFNTTSSKDKASDYLVQHGEQEPELIETWDYSFRPENSAIFDPENHFINKFHPSKFMKSAHVVESAKGPQSIMRVIRHALGGDEQLIEHFLNWLAVIFQDRTRTQSAWVLQGTTGTGKGLLFNEIVRPLIGEDYCRSVTLPNLEDQFNQFMEQCLVLFIDEVDTDQVRDMPKLMARLKNMITEPRISLRAMRTDLREVNNYLNLIMASNKPNSMRIEDNDRRFNICPRQEDKLLKPNEDGDELIEDIRNELPAFADYLASRAADQSICRRAVDNSAKRELQTITQTAIEEVAEALRTGDLEYFVEHATAEPPEVLRRITFGAEHVELIDEYRRVVREAISACTSEKPHVLAHNDLFALFELLVGHMPNTKAKLTKRLGHVQIFVRPQGVSGTSKRGAKVKWNADKNQLRRWKKLMKAEQLRAVG